MGWIMASEEAASSLGHCQLGEAEKFSDALKSEMCPQAPSMNDRTHRHCPYCFTELTAESYYCLPGTWFKGDYDSVMDLKFTI